MSTDLVSNEVSHSWPCAKPKRRQMILGCLAPAGLLVLLGGLLFSSSGRDDCYITYWSAHALASTGEIVNYSGERVEQSSSLAHVLCLAALARLIPLPLPTIGPIASILFGAGTVVATRRLAAVVD